MNGNSAVIGVIKVPPNLCPDLFKWGGGVGLRQKLDHLGGNIGNGSDRTVISFRASGEEVTLCGTNCASATEGAFGGGFHEHR